MYRSDIFYLCVQYTQIYFLGSIIFTRHHARSFWERRLVFFIYFYFSLGKIEYIIYVSRNIGVTVIHNEKFCLVVNMLKFFRTEHGFVSFARQQRRSIIRQWTMFGTDYNGPQLAASVSLFIQCSLVLHLFLFLPSSSKYMYTFWTYFTAQWCTATYSKIYLRKLGSAVMENN